MFGKMKSSICEQLEQMRQAGLFKTERVLTSPQKNRVTVASGRSVLNLCANNYLGLADHPAIIQAAKDSYDTWGYGLSSVRFICGTQKKTVRSITSLFFLKRIKNL